MCLGFAPSEGNAPPAPETEVGTAFPRATPQATPPVTFVDGGCSRFGMMRGSAACPPAIDTPRIRRFTGGCARGRKEGIAQAPAGRMGKPEEIAASVVRLCSETATFAAGHAHGRRRRPTGCSVRGGPAKLPCPAAVRGVPRVRAGRATASGRRHRSARLDGIGSLSRASERKKAAPGGSGLPASVGPVGCGGRI